MRNNAISNCLDVCEKLDIFSEVKKKYNVANLVKSVNEVSNIMAPFLQAQIIVS